MGELDPIKIMNAWGAMLENPDLAFRVVKEHQDIFKISPIEKKYGIPAGSLDSAKKRPQTSFKNSPQLIEMFRDVFKTMVEVHAASEVELEVNE